MNIKEFEKIIRISRKICTLSKLFKIAHGNKRTLSKSWMFTNIIESYKYNRIGRLIRMKKK